MEHVRAFLGRRDVDLSQYAQTFEENGFDNLSYLMELSPKKQRSIAKKIPMPEGHIQRFLDGLKKTKMSVGHIRGHMDCRKKAKTSVGHIGGHISWGTNSSEKQPTAAPKKTNESLPLKLENANQVSAATRSLSTRLGASTQVDRKKSGGEIKTYRCLNVLTQNKDKLQHIRASHRECPFKVVWRWRIDSVSGKKMWHFVAEESHLKHSPMCCSGCVQPVSPDYVPQYVPRPIMCPNMCPRCAPPSCAPHVPLMCPQLTTSAPLSCLSQ